MNENGWMFLSPTDLLIAFDILIKSQTNTRGGVIEQEPEATIKAGE
jgi:hypothetical protein